MNAITIREEFLLDIESMKGMNIVKIIASGFGRHI